MAGTDTAFLSAMTTSAAIASMAGMENTAKMLLIQVGGMTILQIYYIFGERRQDSNFCRENLKVDPELNMDSFTYDFQGPNDQIFKGGSFSGCNNNTGVYT